MHMYTHKRLRKLCAWSFLSGGCLFQGCVAVDPDLVLRAQFSILSDLGIFLLAHPLGALSVWLGTLVRAFARLVAHACHAWVAGDALGILGARAPSSDCACAVTRKITREFRAAATR